MRKLDFLLLVLGFAFAMVLNQSGCLPTTVENGNGDDTTKDTTDYGPFTLKMTRAQIAVFFGQPEATLTGKLIATDPTDNNLAYFIDFADTSLTWQKLCTIQGIKSPLISSNGLYVTFYTGSEASGGTIYTSHVAANAAPVNLGIGFQPHWYTDLGNSLVYIVYSTKERKINWGQETGQQTLKQQIDLTTLAAAVGKSAEAIADFPTNGGLSPDGNYLATAHISTGIYDIYGATKWYQVTEGPQGCNASILPSTVGQPKMMYLTLGETIDKFYDQHEAIIITNHLKTDRTIIGLKPGMTEWQKPEWSTNPNFAVAAGKKDSWDIYLIDLRDDPPTTKLFASSESTSSFDLYPHLWVP